MNEVLLLLSGGMDSSTLLLKLKGENRRVHALSFDYGQRHGVELEFARRIVVKYGAYRHHILHIDYGPMSGSNWLINQEANAPMRDGFQGKAPAYVPGRNLLMLSYAVAYAEAHEIQQVYCGANGEDGSRFPDCSEAFFRSVNDVLASCPNTRNISIQTPLITMSKKEVINLGKSLGLDLRDTISCYSPNGEQPCGECLSCRLRQQADEESAAASL